MNFNLPSVHIPMIYPVEFPKIRNLKKTALIVKIALINCTWGGRPGHYSRKIEMLDHDKGNITPGMHFF